MLTNTGWWYTYPSEKYESIGMIIPNIWENKNCSSHHQPDKYFIDAELYTLWLFAIAMETGPFIDDFPIKTSIYSGFSMAMLDNQMVGL